MLKKIFGLVIAVTLLSGCVKVDEKGQLIKKLEASSQVSQEQLSSIKEWVIYKNEEVGFSLVHPSNFEVSENISETERYISVTGEGGRVFVAISAFKDESLTKEGGLEEALTKKEADLKSNSEYEVKDFAKQLSEDKKVGGYMAVGRMVFVEGGRMIFEERGMMDVYGKMILMHGASVPELAEDNLWKIRAIMESFKIDG